MPGLSVLVSVSVAAAATAVPACDADLIVQQPDLLLMESVTGLASQEAAAGVAVVVAQLVELLPCEPQDRAPSQ